MGEVIHSRHKRLLFKAGLLFYFFGMCSEGGFPSATDRLINLTRYATLQFKGFALQALSSAHGV